MLPILPFTLEPGREGSKARKSIDQAAQKRIWRNFTTSSQRLICSSCQIAGTNRSGPRKSRYKATFHFSGGSIGSIMSCMPHIVLLSGVVFLSSRPFFIGLSRTSIMHRPCKETISVHKKSFFVLPFCMTPGPFH